MHLKRGYWLTKGIAGNSKNAAKADKISATSLKINGFYRELFIYETCITGCVIRHDPAYLRHLDVRRPSSSPKHNSRLKHP
jgi:hypothetical protein